MTSPLLDKIVNAVLYEGYILYPYRSSSGKNMRERFTFGRVYPKDYSEWQKGAESCLCQTECLLRSKDKAATIEVTVRFLQPMWREVGEMRDGTEATFQVARELTVDGAVYQTWQEAVERAVTVKVGASPFFFAASNKLEPLGAESEAGLRRRHEVLAGVVEVEVIPVAGEVFKIIARVLNQTPISGDQCEDSDEVIMRTFASTHTILHAPGSEFISLLDPPAEFKDMADQCKNIGTWPVLAGDQKQGERDTILSSPIILYDYPQIAPESVGSFFDGTEIDEMLTLRVMTMTEGEKAEMRRVDEFARKILERTELAGADNLMKMHGVMQKVQTMEDFFNHASKLQTVSVAGRELHAGSCVRIHPKNRADAFDMMIAGKTAVIEAIEQDVEGRVHLALVLDDDPGKDLGFARQPGHRFFYDLDEVEPVEESA